MKIDPKRIMLQAEVGSTAWGLNLTDKGDRDEMGICIEPYPEAMGLGQPFENEVFRTATVRTGKHDEPSQPGDLDLVIYGLRKYLQLALKGNPTVLTLLYAPQRSWVLGHALGAHLQELAPRIVSRQAGKAFLGYLQAQRMRMKGERGGSHGVKHVEDLERCGYDTKYAMHMLRLGYQGIELLSTGRMSMPMQEETRLYLLSVRRGESTAEAVLRRCGELEDELRGLLTTSPLPESPDRAYVEHWMLGAYWNWWKAEYGHPWSDPYRPQIQTRLTSVSLIAREESDD